MDQIGKYEVLDKIGSGGFAIVYKGYDPFIKRKVAIKVCYSRDEETRQRFFREAEIAGSLVHRNITTVYDFGVQNQMPYLVEEYLPGEDLTHMIRRHEPTDLATRLDFLAQIASGMEYAHQEGVIHRDIKPSNIRVVENGRLKIMDFGTAKLANVESHLTQAGMTLGTVAYLSPERLLGHPTGLNSDIFSYGVLAYEVLSFRRPFSGRNIPLLIDQVLNAAPIHLTDSWPDCPPKLADIVHRCLHKDPAERYHSCSEVLADLEAVVVETLGLTLAAFEGSGLRSEAGTGPTTAQPNVQLSGLLERARQLHARGKLQRAEAMLEEVLEMAPDNAEALALMEACRAPVDEAVGAGATTSSGLAWEGPDERKARKIGEAVHSIDSYIEAGQLLPAVDALKFANQLLGNIEDAPGLKKRIAAGARQQLTEVKGEALKAGRRIRDQMIGLRRQRQLDFDLALRLTNWIEDFDPEDLVARDILAKVRSEAATAANATNFATVAVTVAPAEALPSTAEVSATASSAAVPAADQVPDERERKRREAVQSIEQLLAEGDAKMAQEALKFAIGLFGEFDQVGPLRDRISEALRNAS